MADPIYLQPYSVCAFLVQRYRHRHGIVPLLLQNTFSAFYQWGAEPPSSECGLNLDVCYNRGCTFFGYCKIFSGRPPPLGFSLTPNRRNFILVWKKCQLFIPTVGDKRWFWSVSCTFSFSPPQKMKRFLGEV